MNELEKLQKEVSELILRISETQKAISGLETELADILQKLASPGDPDSIQDRNKNLLLQKQGIEGELERLKSILNPLGKLKQGIEAKIEAIRTNEAIQAWNDLQESIYLRCQEYESKAQELNLLRDEIIQMSQRGDPFSNAKERDVKGGWWKRPDGISKITIRSREYPEPSKTFLYEKPKNLTPKI